ncbi:MAG: hypothetical protein HQK50_06035 [Oligoflexia bacterium]|nr:hypothetical protein [Oligoflexia bacterium]MBF0365110.1 hypothetical protein [Oligoflexia bacterium]
MTMRKINFYFITLLAFTFITITLAPAAVKNQLSSMELADNLYKERSDFTKARSALELYEDLYKATAEKDQKSRQLLLRKLSMANYFVGHHSPKNDGDANQLKRRKDLFNRGIEYANRCISETQESSILGECYFWLATNQVLLSQDEGNFSLVFSLSSVIKNFEKAQELSPTFAGSGALRMLGILHQKMPGIIGGSNKKAEEYLLKAIATSPKEPLNYMFLGKFYAESASTQSKVKALIDQWELQQVKSIPVEQYESLGALKDIEIWKKEGRWPID